MAKRGQALRKASARRRPAKPPVDLKQKIAALERELSQALERESAKSNALTATADVLKVISRSTFDLGPVLATVVETAAQLCQAEMAFVSRRDGDVFRFVTAAGSTPENTATALHFQKSVLDRRPFVVGRGTIAGRVVLEGRALQITDLASDPEYSFKEAVTVAKIRTLLGVPLMRKGEPIGVLTLARQRVEPFTERQIELVRTFADQAVIAIENTRLLTEQREALEQQTATAEVLQVINSSPGDLAPVFDAMLKKAMRLCEAAFGSLLVRDGDHFRTAALYGVRPALAEALANTPRRPGKHTVVGRMMDGEEFVQFEDMAKEPAYLAGDPRQRAFVELGGTRTYVAVALRKDDELIGTIAAYRQEVRPFTERQIGLLQNFAAQAVIAMENARLITETREALEQQTATAEVLQVINESPGDLAPVFDAMLNKALRLCGGAFGILNTYDGQEFHAAAMSGVPAALAAFRWRNPFAPGTAPARMLAGERVIHNIDLMDEEPYRSGDPNRRAIVDLGGARSHLAVALRKDQALLGSLTIYRQEVRPFSDKEIALLQNFAAQAVIAMENARLITETREALERQTATAEVLQVINSSPGDLAQVFEAILEKAHDLCGVAHGSLQLNEAGRYRAVAVRGLPEAFAEQLRRGIIPGPNLPSRQLLEGARFAHVTNWAEIDDPIARAALTAGSRTTLFIPLRKDGKLLGYITASRREVRPFTEKEISLLESFAAQAVIAMENARLLTEQREALEQQTATAEVLQVINSSPGDLAPVFDAMLGKALRLCNAAFGKLIIYEGGGRFHSVAERAIPEPYSKFLAAKPLIYGPGTGPDRVLKGAALVHTPDVMDEEPYRAGEPNQRALVELGGARTSLLVPLRKDNALLGIIQIYRQEVRPFSDKQMALLKNFAAQAVIAMENARLLGELRQRTSDLARSVDELTATGDVLKTISRSSVDLGTVLDTLVETVARLCRADQANMFRWRDDMYQLVAACGHSDEAKEFIRTHPVPPGRGTVTGRAGIERRVVHVADVLQDPEYTYREGQKILGYRTLLGVPLLREETLVGIFTIQRTRVDPFTTKEIELATTFADQAVIAIENARLFDELRQRTADLARSVDELTATGDVLKIISRSSVDLGTVLDTLVETVARLCRADQAGMFRRRDDLYHLVAARGYSEEAKEFFLTHPLAADRGTLTGRVALEHRAVHVADATQDPEYTYRKGQKILGYRTMLGVPLLRGDELIGIFAINRTRVDPFTDKEIELATTFADQAVIAIENARLFEELRDRQAELRVTFDNMGDGVAMFDADRRLAAWNRNFQEILDLPDAFLAKRPSYADYFRYLAERGEYSADLEAELGRAIEDTSREMRLERSRPDGRVIEVRRNPVPDGGFVLIYADITERKRAEAAIRAARDAAEAALRELQTAQASLVHAQKMAALGQLTAGIAHEIKNPLNFVNNFAGLSVDLLDELRQAAAQAIGTPDADKRAEIDETIEMLTGNLKRIAEHGRRADGIVKSMLQHSRGGSGDWQATDLNALVEEALNLAYHGARAQDQSFNITMERDLDDNLAPIDVVPQDVMRVFLNLIGNGFYAANKRSREGDGTFRPVLKVTTRERGGAVEIGVRDNGVGIPSEYRDKLFQPFFTTKPTGEGTGLGLSISYEIVTQQHGGTITVDSEVGHFTEFTVRLPRQQHPAAGRGA